MDMIIDCDTCEVRGKECGDCIVTFLTIPVRGQRTEPRGADVVTMDDAQAAAVTAMSDGGLVPPLRLVHSSDSSRAS
jgi:hypothetical protein